MKMTMKTWIIVVAVVALGLAAGTITAQNAREGNAVSAQDDREGNIVSVQNDQEGDTGKQTAEKAPRVLLSGEGILIGRIDSHSVEIEVDGHLAAFGLSEALREADFSGGGLISFKYYVDESGRSIITEADWQEAEESEVFTAEGIFNGLADSHTAEMEINGEIRSFGLAGGISFAGIEEGAQIFIAYREDNGGRPVIIKIEKLD